MFFHGCGEKSCEGLGTRLLNRYMFLVFSSSVFIWQYFSFRFESVTVYNEGDVGNIPLAETSNYGYLLASGAAAEEYVYQIPHDVP